MKTVPVQKKSFNEGEIKVLIEEWLEASSKFYIYYEKLVTCINEKDIEQKSTEGAMIYIGQCPKHELVALVSTMRSVLEKLTQDINQVDVFKDSATKKQYTKLARHTIILNQLNSQALTRLHLIALISS